MKGLFWKQATKRRTNHDWLDFIVIYIYMYMDNYPQSALEADFKGAVWKKIQNTYKYNLCILIRGKYTMIINRANNIEINNFH